MISRETWKVLQLVKQKQVEQPRPQADVYEVDWTVSGKLIIKASTDAEVWSKLAKRDDRQLFMTATKTFDFGPIRKLNKETPAPEPKSLPVLRTEADMTKVLRLKDGADVLRLEHGALVHVWNGRVDLGLWVFKQKHKTTATFWRALDNTSQVPVPTKPLNGWNLEEVFS